MLYPKPWNKAAGLASSRVKIIIVTIEKNLFRLCFVVVSRAVNWSITAVSDTTCTFYICSEEPNISTNYDEK